MAKADRLNVAVTCSGVGVTVGGSLTGHALITSGLILAAGGQTVLTVRTAAAQQVSSGGGSVDVQVVNENSQWREPIAHSCHFRGVPPNYDPCTTPNTTPDPSRPIGTGTRIATTVMIGLRNVVLDLVDQRARLQLASYGAGKTDLASVLSARREAAETRLKTIEAEGQLAITHAKLAYFTSEDRS
jgi:hypothetical protein